ncbi:MAG: ABC transporter permease, partial [Cyclobacteriaceae bacterium]
MISNYLKVALRSIFRNRLTAFINIGGLALAMASAILIYLYITDEISYDQYNSKSDRIYRVTRSFNSPDGAINLHLGNVAPPIGPLMKNDFGEIEELARTINFTLVVGLEENGELVKNFSEERLFVAEPAVFKIFDINVTEGNPETSLTRPFTVMLSKRTAKRYFDNETNIIGKRLRANNAFDLEVTGVFEDFPPQAHWHPELLVSFSTMENDNIYGRQGLETNWGNNSFGTYLLLEEGQDPKKLGAQMPAFLDKHFGPFAIANFGAPPDFVASKRTSLYIQKVSDIHLYSHLDDEIEVNGNINNVYMMGVIGLFIVLIACFNFVNLSTARATKRSKEVGLRKVVGAVRNQLIAQYLSESILITFFGLALALGLAWFGLGWLNLFTQKSLTMNLIQQPLLLSGLVMATLLIGFLAGIYPAFVVSGFKPALTLKGQQGSVKGKGSIRKILVVTQFSISVVLLIATAITIQQLDYLNSRDLGFDKDQIVTLSYFTELNNSYDAFHNELLRSSSIKNSGRSSRVPTGRLLDSQGGPSILKGDSLVNTGINTKNIRIDPDFFPTYGIPVVAGRNFSRSVTNDDSVAFIINE